MGFETFKVHRIEKEITSLKDDLSLQELYGFIDETIKLRDRKRKGEVI